MDERAAARQARRAVPHARRAVLRAGHHSLAIGREISRRHVALMRHGLAETMAVCGVPNAGGFVVRCGEDSASIRAESSEAEGLRVLELEQCFARARLPHPRTAVEGGRQDALSVRAEAD